MVLLFFHNFVMDVGAVKDLVEYLEEIGELK